MDTFLSGLSVALAMNVLAYDYSGFGYSEGRKSEANCYADIDAAVEYLITRGVSTSDIVLYGRSLGSGPTCYLAERLRCTCKQTHPAPQFHSDMHSREGIPPCAVVLQSPLLSVLKFFCDVPCCGGPFPNASRVPHIIAPILILHGKEDVVVPFWHGQVRRPRRSAFPCKRCFTLVCTRRNFTHSVRRSSARNQCGSTMLAIMTCHRIRCFLRFVCFLRGAGKLSALELTTVAPW
jgi:hypothetical protein